MICNGHCVSIPGPFANNQHVQIISRCNLANIANPHLRNVGLHSSGCPRDLFGQTYLIGFRCTLGLLVVHVHFRMLRQICWWMDPISQTLSSYWDIGGPIGGPGPFLLDRGFQILIEAYPEVKRQLDLKCPGSKNLN